MITVPRLPSRLLFTPIVWSLILVGGGSISRAALDSTEWKQRQEFVLAEPGFTKISLPIETLDLARPDRADVRVLGPDGNEIAYVLETPNAPAPARRPPKTFRVELQKLATQLTVEIGSVELLEGIELETPAREFVKAARIEISLDGKQWELVADGLQLARGSRFNQTTLQLGKTAAAFVRITIDDWRTPVVPFTGATVLFAAAAANPTLPLEAEIVKREEFANETVLTIDLHARHVPLAALEFTVSDPIFSRAVSVTARKLIEGESSEEILASGFISRYQSPQQSLREQLGLPLNFSLSSRDLQVHVVNGSNGPLSIPNIHVRRRPVWLTFDAKSPGKYAILMGNPHVPAPQYDLATFSTELGNIPETPLTIGGASPNPGYHVVDRLAETPLFGSAVDPSKWKFRKIVTPAAAGVQEFELDLDVLSHAQHSCGDLRLIRDGRQAPYLLERTSLFRSLTVTPVAADDPKKPRVSRWRVSLPHEDLPIRRVTLGSDTTLFSRTLQLFETVTDSRGEKSRRALSDLLQWNVTPERHERKLTIELRSTPTTNAIEIEVDNGDNPPISLVQAEADYPVTRVLFRADSKPLYLYYGNDSVTAPRYDLQLVADQLLNEEKNSAKLGGEEATDAAGGTILAGLHGGAALWCALGLVVLVLFVVIARLLPKPPEAT